MTLLPVRYNAVAALRYGRSHTDPPGANRWDSAASKTPVVLLHALDHVVGALRPMGERA